MTDTQPFEESDLVTLLALTDPLYRRQVFVPFRGFDGPVLLPSLTPELLSTSSALKNTTHGVLHQRVSGRQSMKRGQSFMSVDAVDPTADVQQQKKDKGSVFSARTLAEEMDPW